MNNKDLSEDIKQYIFAHIDSVEQVDIMLLLRSHSDKWWSARMISDELRASSSSVTKRLIVIDTLGLIERDDQDQVRYKPKNEETAKIVDELAEAYRVRKHRVLEIIFSPLKRAKSFADAFVISGGKRSGDKDG